MTSATEIGASNAQTKLVYTLTVVTSATEVGASNAQTKLVLTLTVVTSATEVGVPSAHQVIIITAWVLRRKKDAAVLTAKLAWKRKVLNTSIAICVIASGAQSATNTEFTAMNATFPLAGIVKITSTAIAAASHGAVLAPLMADGSANAGAKAKLKGSKRAKA